MTLLLLITNHQCIFHSYSYDNRFRSGSYEESVFLFHSDPTKLRIGKVEAEHHSVDIKVYTTVGDAKNEEDMDEALNVAPPVTTVIEYRLVSCVGFS